MNSLIRNRTIQAEIGGAAYGVTLTINALYKICKRCAGLNSVLIDNPDDLIFYVAALADSDEVTENFIKSKVTAAEFLRFPGLITECMNAGLERVVASPASAAKSKSSEDEMFYQIIYCGTVHMNRTEGEILSMPVGYLLDLLEMHRRYLGDSGDEDNQTVKYIDEIDF
ncbi:hypothetical protein FACS1894188_10180 [Clostridia bacterium]|nr:hypothetical protein FACS1894188_10180 [Clostridia bacterium]